MHQGVDCLYSQQPFAFYVSMLPVLKQIEHFVKLLCSVTSATGRRKTFSKCGTPSCQFFVIFFVPSNFSPPIVTFFLAKNICAQKAVPGKKYKTGRASKIGNVEGKLPT